MADKNTHTMTLQVDLATGDFLLTLPSNFSYTDAEVDAVLAMLPTQHARRHDAA